MNSNLPAGAPDTATRTGLGLALLIFLIAANAPYVWLIEHFGYDDILREPAAAILQKFHAGGAALVVAWLAFSLSSLLFIPVVLGFEALLAPTGEAARGAAALGIASAVAQAIGLLRWVLVVPGLAAGYSDPSATPATREALLVVFEAVHRYGGTVVGEMVGQLLLAGWTGWMALRLKRSGFVPTWLAGVGLFTWPLWLLGQSELLHTVMPGLPAIEVTPIAFIAWELWLAALAVALFVGAIRARATSKEPAMAP